MQECLGSSEDHRSRKNTLFHLAFGAGDDETDLYRGVLATLERTLTPLHIRQSTKTSGHLKLRTNSRTKAG
jgi:hypothetical protein